jgi:hypothetical protein
MKILRKLGEKPFPIGVIAKGKGDARVVV